MYRLMFMYASTNVCILEHEVSYYVAQVYYVSEKTLLSITAFNNKDHPCYFSPLLRKA